MADIQQYIVIRASDSRLVLEMVCHTEQASLSDQIMAERFLMHLKSTGQAVHSCDAALSTQQSYVQYRSASWFTFHL